MSALPPEADIRQRIEHVCFVPLADIQPPHCLVFFSSGLHDYDTKSSPGRWPKSVIWTKFQVSWSLSRADGPKAEPLYLADRCFSWTVKPSCPSTLTAPVFPPSKSLESSRLPVANS
jgi:hypothetical protein